MLTSWPGSTPPAESRLSAEDAEEIRRRLGEVEAIQKRQRMGAA